MGALRATKGVGDAIHAGKEELPFRHDLFSWHCKACRLAHHLPARSRSNEITTGARARAGEEVHRAAADCQGGDKGRRCCGPLWRALRTFASRGPSELHPLQFPCPGRSNADSHLPQNAAVMFSIYELFLRFAPREEA